MYAKNKNNVTFFVDSYNENTDKVTYGRVSESVKTGKKGEDGKDIYEYENWDKAHIVLTEWSARVSYNKEKKASYPYLMVMDFDLQEDNK